jgi:hypothetical protein
MNIYELINNELERLHKALAQSSKRPDHRYLSVDGIHYSGDPSPDGIADRIRIIQDKMLEVFVAHDAEVQKKVAELALTGDPNASKV